MFSVCTIIFGNYENIAKRLLKSIRHFSFIKDIRIGLNAPSEESRQLVHEWAKANSKHCRIFVFEEIASQNLGKYPLMRQMLRYANLASHVMWFDDDSYLDNAVGIDWWQQVDREAKKAAQIGAIHKIMQRGRQFEAIKNQPWYNLKLVNSRHRFTFATGGWWVAKSSVLMEANYPFVELYHNGGDSILGEFLRQQNKKLVQFKALQCHCESCNPRGVTISAPVVHINVGGRKGRRGIGTTGEKYVWADGNLDPDLSHQSFSLRVFCYGP